MIRSALPSDAHRIAQIYNPYILNTVITFEETPVTETTIQNRLAEVQAADLPWLVLEQNGQVVGYAYAAHWKLRSAFRYTLETSIYLEENSVGQGLGIQLYAHLLDALKKKGFHVAVAGLALPNLPSAALHEKLGFHKVAHFPAVGFKFQKWIDVGYWQITLS